MGKISSQFDVLAVGDVVTDAFIKLKDDRAEIIKGNPPKLAMEFGTKIPFERAQVCPGVGNASNAGFTFAKLGFKSGFVSNVGDDSAGRDTISYLKKNKVDTRFIHINPGHETNYHYVLWYKEERTILIKHEEFDYHWPKLKSNETPKWIYFSSVAESALPFHDELADWLEENEDVNLAFQPGTFQMAAGVNKMERIYRRSELVAVNREEAANITGGDHDDINDLFDRLHKLGPRIVVISDGPKGSYASDGTDRFWMPIYPDPKPPFERTGAGDAFTSTFVACIMGGNTIEGALQWAPINAMSVVQKVGAQAGLLTEKEMAELLVKAPKDYKPKKL